MKEPNKGWLTSLAGLCVLVGTVALLFAPTLKLDMFADDFALYTSRPLGRAFVGYFLRGEKPDASYPFMFYRPMADFIWAVYFALFGQNIHLYHAWTVSMHFLNALLVWLCARRLLLLDRKWAIAAGLVFAALWFNFDAVAWLCANETALCAAFMMASLLCSGAYFRSGRPFLLVLLFFTALLAAFTKEFTLILPALTGVLWVFPFNSDRGPKRSRLFAAISVTTLAVAVYMIARCSLAFPVLPPEASIPNALVAAYRLAAVLLGPLAHFSLSLMGMILFLAALILKRTRLLAIWVGIGILPAASKGIDPRYAYIAGIGLALLIAALLQESARAKDGWERTAARVWLGVFAAVGWTELLSVNGDSVPWMLLSAAAVLGFLLFVLAKRWIERPEFLSMFIAGLIVLANFGNAADYPWIYPIFAEVRPLAEKIAPLLPHGGDCRYIVFEGSLLRGEHRAVPVKILKPYILLISGKDVETSDIGDFYESLPGRFSPEDNAIVFMRQRGDTFERMRNVEGLLFEKARSYGTPPPPDLNLDIGQPDSTESPAFRLSAPPEEGIAWLDFSASPLDPVAYDLVSIDFANLGDSSSTRAWLEWYPAGSEQPARRCYTEVKDGLATFELRNDVNWLTAGPIRQLILGIHEGTISLYPTAARIARQPLILQRRLKLMVEPDVLKRSGALREPGDH